MPVPHSYVRPQNWLRIELPSLLCTGGTCGGMTALMLLSFKNGCGVLGIFILGRGYVSDMDMQHC